MLQANQVMQPKVKMAKSAKALEKARLKSEVARLSSEGLGQTEIASRLGISKTRVAYWLARLKEEFLKEAEIDFGYERVKAYYRLERLMNEYWESWRKSSNDKVTISQENIQGGGTGTGTGTASTKSKVQRETRVVGDVAFLNGAKDCVVRQINLYGLEMPRKIAPTDPSGEHEYGIMSEADRYAQIMKIIRSAEERQKRNSELLSSFENKQLPAAEMTIEGEIVEQETLSSDDKNV